MRSLITEPWTCDARNVRELRFQGIFVFMILIKFGYDFRNPSGYDFLTMSFRFMILLRFGCGLDTVTIRFGYDVDTISIRF